MASRGFGKYLLIGLVAVGLYGYHHYQVHSHGHSGSGVTKSSVGALKSSGVSAVTDASSLMGMLSNWDYGTDSKYYKSLGSSGIDSSDFPSAGVIQNSSLDSLGRSGEAKGSITLDMFKKSRGHAQSFTNKDNPSGFDTSRGSRRVNWNTVKGEVKLVDGDGKTYSGWFYNRSHLIGDALGGASTKVNVTTGTRFQNVGSRSNDGGMRYSESQIENYFKSKANSQSVVYYDVRPLYSGDELVPRGTYVSFKSSDGVLDESVLVSNSAKGYVIDYTTGDFHLSE